MDRILICANCGALSNVDYVKNVTYRKRAPMKFVCPVCGMKVNVLYFKEE